MHLGDATKRDEVTLIDAQDSQTLGSKPFFWIGIHLLLRGLSVSSRGRRDGVMNGDSEESLCGEGVKR